MAGISISRYPAGLDFAPAGLLTAGVGGRIETLHMHGDEPEVTPRT
jgi:hypothetical protein